MELTDTQFERYARNMILDEVGDEGQEKLLAARVLVVGAGGLGAPVLMYLAAAGVGTLGIADDDTVDLSNLQRQVIHTTAQIGAPKVASAAAMIGALNPDINVQRHGRITADNAADIIADYDVVADGSDNFATRYILNDACYLSHTPLVCAALLRFDGQLFTFRRGDDGHGCYRCVFPQVPDPNLVPRCDQAGVLGTLCGVMGSLQANEVVKQILGLGDSLAGRMLMFDALATAFHTISLPRAPNCALCGDTPTITRVSAPLSGANDALTKGTS